MNHCMKSEWKSEEKIMRDSTHPRHSKERPTVETVAATSPHLTCTQKDMQFIT